MKRLFVFAFVVVMSISATAQTITEEFESNSLGWTEYVTDMDECCIKDGVLHFNVGVREHNTMLSTTYLPIDPTKNFDIEADLCSSDLSRKVAECTIGVIFNYRDDYNYDSFSISAEEVVYRRWIDNKLVGYRKAQLRKFKNVTDYQLVLKSSYQKLEFFVNNMKALEVRYAPITFSGFGIYCSGVNCKVDVERVVITQ